MHNRDLWTALFARRRNRVTAYRTTVQSILSPNVYLVPEANQGNEFQDLISATQNLGTNTAYGGTITTPTTNAILGEPFISGNATTSSVDLATLINGSFPTALTVRIRARADNWASGGTDYLFALVKDGSNFWNIKVNSTGTISAECVIATVATNVTSGVMSAGFHDIVVTWAASSCVLYIDGASIGSASPAAAPTGTILRCIVMALTTTPNNPFDGDVTECAIKLNSAIGAPTVTSLYAALSA